MMLRRAFRLFFDKWWLPLLVFGFGLIMFFATLQGNNDTVVKYALLFCACSLFLMAISVVYQLFYKRWIKALVTAVLLGSTIAGVFFYMATMYFIETIDGDRWAENLEVPSNVPVGYPAELEMDDSRPDSIVALNKLKPDLLLYNSFQPGLYQYDFWYGKIEKGTIFLKAFEITQGVTLSADRLPESSLLEMENPTDSIRRFSTQHYFTIYEGDWGDPYAARFEVWFRPAAGGKERKLYSKNFVIEGWQR